MRFDSARTNRVSRAVVVGVWPPPGHRACADAALTVHVAFANASPPIPTSTCLLFFPHHASRAISSLVMHSRDAVQTVVDAARVAIVFRSKQACRITTAPAQPQSRCATVSTQRGSASHHPLLSHQSFNAGQRRRTLRRQPRTYIQPHQISGEDGSSVRANHMALLS